MNESPATSNLSRRALFKPLGVGAAVTSAGGSLVSCSSGLKGSSAGGGGDTSDGLKIGYVSPQTSPHASFVSSDNVVLGLMRKKAGYTVVDGGAYRDGSSDYSTQISKFRGEEAELFTCTPPA
jgi:branched-chain amino acid transport system substrate-binding protein